MPRAKRASDDVYNARRRIRRAAKAAERRGETERARQLRVLAQNTYIGRGASANVARAASAALAALGKLPTARQRRESAERHKTAVSVSRQVASGQAGSAGGVRHLVEAVIGQEREQDVRHKSLVGALRSIARGSTSARRGSRDLTSSILTRRNELFARQLNLASAGADSTLDRPDISGKAQARIFWMSTRRMWMGEAPDRRYEVIMRELRTSSLEDAFRKVMDFNRDAVQSAIDIERPVRDTVRDMVDERGDEPVAIGSPPEFMYMVRDAYNLMA